MQIIQSIRDKGAAIVIVVIALSLFSFILMDAQQGGSKLFGTFSNDVGKVNGHEITYNEFTKRVANAEDMQAQRTGQRPSGTQTYDIREQTWNQVVAENIFYAEAEKLGIKFTPKELSFILLSNDPSNPFLQEQSLRDSTGRLDINKAKTALNNIKKMKGEQKENVNNQIVEPLRLNNTVSKYSALLSASAYYPTWMQKKESEDNQKFSNISFVTIPYSDISDSTVKVSDQDINDYVSKHKEQFKQEAGRVISYVNFSQLPSSEDSQFVYNTLLELKPAFTADSNAKSFVARNLSTVEFKDEFQPLSKLNKAYADTLTKLSNGMVFGPVVDGQNYVLAKLLGSKQLADSAKARHILISTRDMQSGAEIMSDTLAKKLADSLLAAIKGGADFAALASKYSADKSNKDKGGDLGTFAYGAMVSEFNDFCFNQSPGSKDVVKTQFGYHIIDLVSQKDFKSAYKIAYLGRDIFASEATLNKASLDATKASAEKDKAGLEKYITKIGKSFNSVSNPLKENDYQVGALQDARSLVKWAFESKVGNVSEPFNIGDQFVVAVLDKIIEKGTMDAATARPGCEAIIKNQKKAEIIKKKIGANPTLESVQAAYGKTIQNAGADSSLLFTSQIINGVGMEAKVIGAAFNKDYQSKVSPLIDGTTGVFIIKVNSIQSKPDLNDMASQRTSKMNTLRSQTNGWYEGLKKQSDITDNRSNFY